MQYFDTWTKFRVCQPVRPVGPKVSTGVIAKNPNSPHYGKVTMCFLPGKMVQRSFHYLHINIVQCGPKEACVKHKPDGDSGYGDLRGGTQNQLLP